MIDYSFKLNGINNEKYQPSNLEELEIIADFDNTVQPNITANEIVFTGEAASEINNYIDGGINNTTRGIFEGIPFEIILLSEYNPYNAFKGYIDLLEIKRKCEEVTVKLVSEEGLNKFSERCQATTFGHLFELGYFPKTSLTPVPYVINYIPDGMQVIMIGISLYLMSKELYETVPKIPEHTAAVVLAATPSIGFPSINVGNIIIQSIKLALLLAYTVIMVLAIIKLIDSLFTEIYSIKRWYRACKVKTLLEKACEYLGFKFSSSIFTGVFEDLVFLPYKTKKGTIAPNDSHANLFAHTITDDTGVPNSMGYGYTVYEMFELVKNMFNAKIIIKNGTVYLESKANKVFWENQSTYILPDIEVLEKQYNTSELNPNYIIKFQYDISDMNTIDNFTGTNYERITSPIYIGNTKNLNFGGLTEININAALGTRKDKKNVIEELLEGLANVVDSLIGIFNGHSNFLNGFQDRIGVLEVSEHAGWQPKILLVKSSKIPANHRDYLSAKYLYNNYHYVDSFVADDFGGQYELYKNVIIPFCIHDFMKTIENSHFVTTNGEKGKFEKITWNFTQGYAKVDYRIKKPYTKNLKEIFIEA